MPANINKYFSLFKYITFTLLFVTPAPSLANTYSVEYIIDLEKKLNKLKSEILITQNTVTNSYSKQNPALYYLKKNSWKQSLQSISPGNSTSAPEYKNYTNILYGISLQGMNRKKEALDYYNQVPNTSIHYATAQLNRALLYMHDGLTNKSFNIINTILTDPLVILSGETKNKILLTFGYLYYKEKKYAESRNIFRKVEVDSIYSNRALTGIALDALHLKDYSSSQHVLSLLNNETNYDLPADESYLLKAFIYQSQKKYDNATIAYNNAITHYEKRIKNINDLLQGNKPLTIDQILNNHIFILSSNKIDLLEEMPETFFNNYTLLKQLIQTIQGYGGVDNNMHTRATSLYANYNNIIYKLLIKMLSKRKKALLDYLNQSKYGLVISNDKLLSSEKNSNG